MWTTFSAWMRDVSKQIPLGERVNLFLMFEGFNIFNTPYDTGVNTTQYILNTKAETLSPISSFGYGNASQAFRTAPTHGGRRSRCGLLSRAHARRRTTRTPGLLLT